MHEIKAALAAFSVQTRPGFWLCVSWTEGLVPVLVAQVVLVFVTAMGRRDAATTDMFDFEPRLLLSIELRLLFSVAPLAPALRTLLLGYECPHNDGIVIASALQILPAFSENPACASLSQSRMPVRF